MFLRIFKKKIMLYQNIHIVNISNAILYLQLICLLINYYRFLVYYYYIFYLHDFSSTICNNTITV